jgi:hypothetical protein
MRIVASLSLVVAIAFTLAACSQSAQPLVPAGFPLRSATNGALSVLPAGFSPAQARPDWMRPPPKNAQNAGLAVAEFGGSSVLWFKQNDRKNQPPKVCEPASSTNGIRIDRYGNLWVPDGKTDTTTEYTPNCGAAELTITDTDGEPADVGFDRKNRVYILNLTGLYQTPTVDVYTAKGAARGSLTDPSFDELFGVNSDNHGNVFVSNLTSSNHGNVVEFKGGKMPGTQLSGISLALPGVPAFDSADNLIISDWGRATIDVFAPPYSSAPKTAPLMGSSIWCALDHQQQQLYCGDAGHGSIDVYAYPSLKYRYSFTNGLSASALVTGVAPDPPEKYWP